MKSTLDKLFLTILAAVLSFIFLYFGINREKISSDKIYNSNEVTKIVDGDTIKIYISGEEKTVRLIGIDTPETVDPRKEIECFGKEASTKITELLQGEIVEFEFDKSQGEVDKYGRLLLYVWRQNDNLFINKYMIEQGYASEYTYNDPYKYQNEFKKAEIEAIKERRGLWGDICN